jgi:signal transduction histidine kinase
VDTTALVQEVLEELKPQLINRHVEIEIGDPEAGFPVLPPSNADPLLLKQVYANLLANALKFTRDREVARIRIGFRHDNGEGIFFIADNGVGFDMEDAGRLFGVFQRLHSEEEFEGTGIGLAIVARVIRRHGGRVWAEAKVDGGATFFFTLGPPSSGPPLALETNETGEET